MSRHLATIRRITRLEPIPNKDRIELAFIDGWQVIVKKGEFEVGGKCVYVEIDSVLPPKPEFEFLKSKNYRIKTMKMSGVRSEGICFPMSILPGNELEYPIDKDVTDLLGIKQYEETMDDGGSNVQQIPEHKTKWPWWLMKYKWFRRLVTQKRVNGFPSFVQKTDECRVQNAPFYLQNKSVKWDVTEKCDGQSGTFVLVKHKSKIPFMKPKYEFIVCSRNRRLGGKPDGTSYWDVTVKYDIENVLKKMIWHNDWVCIQGECVGPKIQGNKYKFKSNDLYVFNVIYGSRNERRRLPSPEGKKVVEQYGLKFVPIVATGVTLPDTVDEMLKMAHGQSAIGDTLREGLVCRSVDGVSSFKAVDPEFLMKYDE